MISFHPGIQALAKAFGRPWPDLETAAVERWTIAPRARHYVAPARCLPDQLDRVRGVSFGSHAEVVQNLKGGFDSDEPETLGFRLRDIDLVDGVLYGAGVLRHLRRRLHRLPLYVAPTEVTRGALYESWVGNRWFGNWLADDCLTYRLAESYGEPVTTARRSTGHMSRYERLLGITPRRVGSVHFDELIVFSDLSHNADKQHRATQLRERLTTQVRPTSRAGVFMLRGQHGDRRMLRNERTIADLLHRRHGFQILDPMTSSVDQIVAACADARVIMGVEGSHLVHGLMVMPRDATLFVIQPPDRVVCVLKRITDRQQQHFAFVVGEGCADDFTVRMDEVERTLDLAAA